MDIKTFLNDLENIDFEKVVRVETLRYLSKNSNDYRLDAKKLINDGLKLFSDKGDKIIYLVESINYLNLQINHLNKLYRKDFIDNYEKRESHMSIYDLETYNDYKQKQKKQEILETARLYAIRGLEKLGISKITENAFEKTEVVDVEKKLDIILAKIDTLKMGQEIIYDQIEDFKSEMSDLKNDFPLGKKRWYQRLSGVIAEHAIDKGFEKTIEYLKPDILSLLHKSGIDKLLL